MPRFLFPDNSAIVSFSKANQLAVLEAYLGGKGKVVEAVSAEIKSSVAHTPNLWTLDQQVWFGDPIEISGKDKVQRIEGIRVAVFGGTKAKPREHLGESQTLFLLQEKEFKDSVWITEDRDAYRFARRQRVVARDIFGMLSDMVGSREITSEQAFQICENILEADRGLLRPPRTHRDFLL